MGHLKALPIQPLVLGLATFILSCCAPVTSYSQPAPYPSRPIRVVVPYPPAGTTDIVARLLAAKLTIALKQTVQVENKAGAGGAIGSDFVAKAAPDGYTLLLGATGPITVSQSLSPKPSYDSIRDFAPISIVATVPTMLVVNPKLAATSVAELIALAKANPGKLNFASTGSGATPHLSGELFKLMAGVDIKHVPYKGSAPAVTDLIGGQVDLMFEQIPGAMPFVQSGQLRALAMGSAKRVGAYPNIPTVAESGLTGFDMVAWFGLLAPANTPSEVIKRLNAEVTQIMSTQEVKDKLVSIGAEPQASTTAEFSNTIATEIPKWRSLIEKLGPL
ncbi:PBP2_Bug27 domain containing protein [Burkholderiaceae bacterium]